MSALPRLIREATNAIDRLAGLPGETDTSRLQALHYVAGILEGHRGRLLAQARRGRNAPAQDAGD